MKESQFKKIFFKNLEDYRNHEKIVDMLYNVKFDITSSDLLEIYYLSFDRVNSLLFNEEGVDWFNWYLFEKPENCNTFEYNNITILVDTDEKMYNFLKQFSSIPLENDSYNKGC